MRTIRLSRPEMDATAARAKAGDRQAFEQLISATIGLYYHLARWVPSQDRDDVVCASVLHTYHVLERYDPAYSWVNFVGRAIFRFQQRHYLQIRFPVSVSIRTRTGVQQARLPERMNGVADPSLLLPQPGQYVDPAEELAAHQDIHRLRQALTRFEQREQGAILLDTPAFLAKYSVSRQRYHQIRNEVMAILRRRMGVTDAELH